MHHDKKQLKKYFTNCGSRMVRIGQKDNRPAMVRAGLQILKNIDTLINTTYEPKTKV